MLAYKVFMLCSALVFFGCVGAIIFGYVKTMDEALKSLKGRVEP